jgi:hypothetical protein
LVDFAAMSTNELVFFVSYRPYFVGHLENRTIDDEDVYTILNSQPQLANNFDLNWLCYNDVYFLALNYRTFLLYVDFDSMLSEKQRRSPFFDRFNLICDLCYNEH